MCRRYLLLFLVLLLPELALAVSISEVAWMGSTASANHEWIELYNAGAETSVEGWTLSDGMNFTITLAGSIPAQRYAVLERTSEASAPGTAFLVYTGALVNTGATLTLRRADGTIADQVVGGENWESIGGDNVTKETAQYGGTRWVTAAATPGSANATESTPEADEETDEEVGAAPKKSGGGGGTAPSRPATKRTIVLNDVPTQPEVTLVFPETVTVGQPVAFGVTVTKLGKGIVPSLTYAWNFGDLTTATGSTVTHTYTHAGTYTVVATAAFKEHRGTARSTITVLPQQFSLAYAPSGDLFIHNDARYEVDISGFTVVAGKRIAIPSQTYLAAGASLTIARAKLGTPVSVPLLLDRGGSVVATLQSVPEVADVVSAVGILSGDVLLPPVGTTESVEEHEASLPLVLAPAYLEAGTSTALMAAVGGAPTTPLQPYLPYLGLLAIIGLGVLAIVAGQVSLKDQSLLPQTSSAIDRPSPFI